MAVAIIKYHLRHCFWDMVNYEALLRPQRQLDINLEAPGVIPHDTEFLCSLIVTVQSIYIN